MSHRTITTTMQVTSVDVQAMRDMSDFEYRKFISGDLLTVDHEGVLRSGPAGYPIAAYKRQLSILIEHLRSLESQLPRE